MKLVTDKEVGELVAYSLLAQRENRGFSGWIVVLCLAGTPLSYLKNLEGQQPYQQLEAPRATVRRRRPSRFMSTPHLAKRKARLLNEPSSGDERSPWEEALPCVFERRGTAHRLARRYNASRFGHDRLAGEQGMTAEVAFFSRIEHQ